MKKKPAHKPEEMLDCIDRLDRHCHNLQTLAQLLLLCDETSCQAVDARMVGGTAGLLLGELEKLRICRDRLAQKIKR